MLKSEKRLNIKMSLPKNGTKRPGRNVSAVHGQRYEKIGAAELEMTSALTNFGEACFLEFSEDFFRSQDGKLRRHSLRRGLEHPAQMFQRRFEDPLREDFRRVEQGEDTANCFQTRFQDREQPPLSTCFWLEQWFCLEKRHPTRGTRKDTNVLL